MQIEPEYLPAQNNLAWLLHTTGLDFERKGDTKKAIEQYKRALEHNPRHLDARNRLAAMLGQRDRIDQMLEHCTRTVELYPDDGPARFYLAQSLLKNRQTGQAIVHYRQALKLDYVNESVHGGLADALRMEGEFEQAVRHFAEALRLKPDLTDSRVGFAKSLTELGRTQAAIDQYKRVLRYQANHFEALNGLAWIWATAGDLALRNPDSAVEYAHRACELTMNTHPEMLDTLAAAYAASGKFSDAVATAQKAIKLADKSDRNDLVNQIRERLVLYKSNKAYRMKESSPVD